MEADLEGYANHPVGNGAFQFDEWATGDHLSFTANKNWWGGEINFDKLSSSATSPEGLYPRHRSRIRRRGHRASSSSPTLPTPKANST